MCSICVLPLLLVMGLDDRDADVLGDPKDACDCSGCGSQRKERNPPNIMIALPLLTPMVTNQRYPSQKLKNAELPSEL